MGIAMLLGILHENYFATMKITILGKYMNIKLKYNKQWGEPECNLWCETSNECYECENKLVFSFLEYHGNLKLQKFWDVEIFHESKVVFIRYPSSIAIPMAHSGQAGLGVPPSFFPGFQLPIQSILEANEFAYSNCKYPPFSCLHKSSEEILSIRPLIY